MRSLKAILEAAAARCGCGRRAGWFRGAVSLATLALFLLGAGVPSAEAQFRGLNTQFGKNKVTYQAFDFWVYEGPHFDVYYYPEEEDFLDEVVAFSEHAYQLISSTLGHELSERTPIIFYRTHAEFQQTHIIPFFLPEGVAAFAEPTVRRLVLPVDDPPDQLLKLMIHEITHIFEYDYFFGSDVGRALRISPPGWVMEGLAEHMADNLTTLDEMLLRDVVLSDNIPTLVQMTYNRGFFVDYVLGQAVWDYIADEYGSEGVRIFMGEIRRDLGQDIERDLERAFNVTPGEFNSNFRAWLRDRYLPDVLEHDEAEDFGTAVFAGMPPLDRPAAFTPVLSPDGDEFVALTVNFRRSTLEAARFDVETGRKLETLSRDAESDYEYIIGQGLTVGFRAGNDLSWSPDGRQVAFFGRTGPTRTLFVVDARDGSVLHEKKLDDLDQALSPSIGPDGRVAFGAHRNGVPDIWIWDPRDDSLANVTQDDLYDYAPVWSPDGNSLVFASHVLRHKKLFRIDLARPQERVQLTFGQSNDTQPSFSEDGSALYFSSDRTGKFDIYGLRLADGTVERYTNLLHGGFFPQPIPNTRRLLFSAFGDQEYELYTMELPEPLETFAATTEALPEGEITRIEQEMADAATVSLDQDNVNRSPSGGWHIEDVIVAGGVTSRGTVLSNTGIVISDLLGNHRITTFFGSYSRERNVFGSYENLKNRLNWGVSGTSQRLFFFTFDPVNNDFDRRAFFELDGGEIFASYPFSRDARVELSAGFFDRAFLADFALFPTTGEIESFNERFIDGTYVPLGAGLVVDKARFKVWGPFDGRRLRFDVRAAPGLGDLQFTDFTVDAREYVQVTANSLFAVRYYGAFSTGDDPNVFFFGGLNQLRGARFLQFSGSRATYLNLEYRFPLIFEARAGELAIRHIRGTVFLDVGAAWFEDQDFDLFDDGRLKDGRAAFGVGVGFNLGPLPLHFFLSQRTDFQSLIDGLEFDFYLGPSF